MAILPSGDIPDNPFGGNSRSSSPPPTRPGQLLPVSSEFRRNLEAPIPMPATDWHAVIRNVVLAAAAVFVIFAIFVAAFSQELKDVISSTSAKSSPHLTTSNDRQNTIQEVSGQTGTEPINISLGSISATSTSAAGTALPAIYHPTPEPIEWEITVPNEKQPLSISRPTDLSLPIPSNRALRRSSPSIPLLPDPSFP